MPDALDRIAHDALSFRASGVRSFITTPWYYSTGQDDPREVAGDGPRGSAGRDSDEHHPRPADVVAGPGAAIKLRQVYRFQPP